MGRTATITSTARASNVASGRSSSRFIASTRSRHSTVSAMTPTAVAGQLTTGKPGHPRHGRGRALPRGDRQGEHLGDHRELGEQQLLAAPHLLGQPPVAAQHAAQQPGEAQQRDRQHVDAPGQQ